MNADPRNRFSTQAGQAGGPIAVLARLCRAAIERGDASMAHDLAVVLAHEANRTHEANRKGGAA